MYNIDTYIYICVFSFSSSSDRVVVCRCCPLLSVVVVGVRCLRCRRSALLFAPFFFTSFSLYFSALFSAPHFFIVTNIINTLCAYTLAFRIDWIYLFIFDAFYVKYLAQIYEQKMLSELLYAPLQRADPGKHW